MRYILFLFILILSACNSVYYEPNSIKPGSTVYIDRGGYTMKRSIKQNMKERGYVVLVGKAKSSTNFSDENIRLATSYVPENTKYVVEVNERSERLAPIWCMFNGFWWWNFNVSIADQNTGKELLSWRGRGCQNSSLRMLDKILDDIEIKQAE